MLFCVQALEKMGFTLYGSQGTADYGFTLNSEHGVKIQDLTWINENLEVLLTSSFPFSDGGAIHLSIAGYIADQKWLIAEDPNGLSISNPRW